MVSKAQGKFMIERIAKRYRFIEENPEVLGEPLSEQDLKTKFIVPMLQALNWDIYDFDQVREQKNFYGFLPDYILTDKHGKIIFVEAKPPSAYRELENDLRKYSGNPNVRKKASVILLTTFKDSKICVLGKTEGLKIDEISYTHYITEFGKLWGYLSDSEEGFKTRTYQKAWTPRGLTNE